MDAQRRRWSLTAAALLLPWPALAIDLMEEVEYRVIPQQPLADPSRIEVAEFFYYGCRWCNELEPYVRQWLQRKPADVVFRLQPAIRSTRWMTLTKTFYLLEAQGKVAALHGQVYRAYHRDGLNLEDEAVLTDWLVKQGLERGRVEELLYAPETLTRVEAAREATYAYRIETTPSVVVDGRYLTSTDLAGGVAVLMDVVEGLVAMAREERRSAARFRPTR
jgi:thiol:disulfide interchange protein DsbA